MDDISYNKLYTLQDKVLDCVFECENEFYLTGGTCLGRFYQQKRYSDDLDFFTNNSSRYSFAVKNIKQALQKKFDLIVKVESKSFIRFKIDNLLQIDFVNDIAARYKDVKVLENNYIIDNVENILSNKLTAVIGRDNPKDVFDIYLISKFYTFAWEDILNSAHEKAEFNNEDLIIRLKSFPINLLERIKLVDIKFLNNFKNEFMTLIEDISNISE